MTKEYKKTTELQFKFKKEKFHKSLQNQSFDFNN